MQALLRGVGVGLERPVQRVLHGSLRSLALILDSLAEHIALLLGRPFVEDDIWGGTEPEPCLVALGIGRSYLTGECGVASRYADRVLSMNWTVIEAGWPLFGWLRDLMCLHGLLERPRSTWGYPDLDMYQPEGDAGGGLHPGLLAAASSTYAEEPRDRRLPRGRRDAAHRDRARPQARPGGLGGLLAEQQHEQGLLTLPADHRTSTRAAATAPTSAPTCSPGAGPTA
ncbi:unnamed protein product [Prorocentrum cordatum]|uniref:Uncharacterized protein n=1 Tax=Prorocentrum cordatum TaxID=2364126 RepID=A0ABN9U868_9DINO|nr:unnamed protein product [Polarella glacialis]